jgi:hypothetical protein
MQLWTSALKQLSARLRASAVSVQPAHLSAVPLKSAPESPVPSQPFAMFRGGNPLTGEPGPVHNVSFIGIDVGVADGKKVPDGFAVFDLGDATNFVVENSHIKGIPVGIRMSGRNAGHDITFSTTDVEQPIIVEKTGSLVESKVNVRSKRGPEDQSEIP